MFDESSLITKLFVTVAIAFYVVCVATLYYPLTVYGLLLEMVEHVWGLEPNQMSASNK